MLSRDLGKVYIYYLPLRPIRNFGGLGEQLHTVSKEENIPLDFWDLT